MTSESATETFQADPGNTRLDRYLLLGSLYVSQSVGVGFLYLGLSGILRARGVSLEVLGSLQALGLLWALKFLWAPFVDRYGSPRLGHYRGWLLVLQPLVALTLLALVPFADPVRDFWVVVAIAGLYILLAGTQDIAADGLAARVLAPGERGVGNGIQMAGGFLATILGGGLSVVVYERFGWAAAVCLVALATALPFALILRFKEPALRGERPSTGDAFRALVSVLRQPGCGWWALAAVPLYYVGLTVTYSLLTPALIDAGWSPAGAGLTMALVAGGPAILGSLAGGYLVNLLGRGGALTAGAIAAALCSAPLWPLLGGSSHRLFGTVAVCLFLAAYAAASTVIYVVNMDFTRPATAGTDFTALNSLAMVVSYAASALSLVAAGQLGYQATMLGSLLFLAVGVLIGRRVLTAPVTRPALADRLAPDAAPM